AVDDPDGARDGGDVDLEEAEDQERDERRRHDAAGRAPHVTRRDVAPPAVVEAEEREDAELDRGDEGEDLPAQVALVVDGQVGVEAEPEGEVPGRDDDGQVRGELREPMPVEGSPHRADATPTAARTTSTTRSCCSAVMPA